MHNEFTLELDQLEAELHELEVDTFEIEDIADADQQAVSGTTSSTCSSTCHNAY